MAKTQITRAKVPALARGDPAYLKTVLSLIEIHINYETQIIPHGQDAADYSEYGKGGLPGRNGTGNNIEFTHKTSSWRNSGHGKKKYSDSGSRIWPNLGQALEIIKGNRVFHLRRRDRRVPQRYQVFQRHRPQGSSR